MVRLALGCVRAGFRNRPSEEKDHTAEASARRGSGVLAARCVLYPPHSMQLLLPDGVASTELVNSRMVAGSVGHDPWLDWRRSGGTMWVTPIGRCWTKPGLQSPSNRR